MRDRTGQLLGLDNYRDWTFNVTGRLPGPDVCSDWTFTVTGRLT